MEEPLKDYLAKQMLGKHLHFHCDCIVSMDVDGVVRDYELSQNEIIFIVDVGGKLIRIGENHPNMKISLIWADLLKNV